MRGSREQAHLEVVAEHKHGDAGAQGAEPLYQHLREALRVFVGYGIEEVAAEEVEGDAAPGRPRVMREPKMAVYRV